MRHLLAVLVAVLLAGGACGDDAGGAASSTSAAAVDSTTTTTTTTTSAADPMTPSPEEVWGELVTAFNAGDLDALSALFSADVEWSYSNFLGIRHDTSGREEVLRGLDDLMRRGVTYESQITEVSGARLTAQTVFDEPGLAEALGFSTLLQVDVVTVQDGVIVEWVSTADATVPVDG